MVVEVKVDGSVLREALWGVLGFEPTGVEQRRVLESRKRFIMLAGGEQGGKSLTASKFFQERMIEDMERRDGESLLYWLIGDAYSETAREFGYIADDLVALGLPAEVTKRVDPGLIELKFRDERRARVRIETKSGADIRRMSRDAPDGIIICEAFQTDILVYERAQGRLAPRNGWLFMSGTFEEEGSGWARSLYEAWKSGADDRQSFSLPSYTNTHLYPGGRNDPKILELERHSSDRFFTERIEGKPVPPRGLVFPEFRADLHVRDVSWVEGEDIYMWEDPGYGRSVHALEIAQIIQGQVRVIDEIYERGLVTEEIIQIAMARPWWKEATKHLVSDPSYKDQHHSMTSVSEQWEKQAGLYAQGDRIKINEGSERLRGFLKPDPIFREPKIVFSPLCRGVLSEFGASPNPFDGETHPYRWKTDRDGTIVGQTPEDRYNDGIKATIYGLVAQYGTGYVTQKTIPVRRH